MIGEALHLRGAASGMGRVGLPLRRRLLAPPPAAEADSGGGLTTLSPVTFKLSLTNVRSMAPCICILRAPTLGHAGPEVKPFAWRVEVAAHHDAAVRIRRLDVTDALLDGSRLLLRMAASASVAFAFMWVLKYVILLPFPRL